MPEFIPGIQLNEAYYNEIVQPILAAQFPNLTYSAGLIGFGSDVIGFDTPVSRDHLWGPRLIIFLSPADYSTRAEEINQVLRHHLPAQFRGYSTNFSEPNPLDGGTQVSAVAEKGPINHLITFTTIENFWNQELGINPFQDLDAADWLTFQEHRLLTLTTGKIYHDGLALETIRQKFAYYPNDVWYYLMAAQWGIISQEEAFVGRTHQVGDELGSQIISARLVERLVHLFFLMEKRYAPYSKWFGTAFKTLACYPIVGPVLEKIAGAINFHERDDLFRQVYIEAANMHNALNITPPLEARTRTYSGWHCLRDGVELVDLEDPRNTRPFQVLFAGRFCDALLDQVKDPAVLGFRRTPGSVNQFLVESSDALQSISFCRGLKPLLTDQS